MTLLGVRIVKAKHASSAFSGEGARVFGGRWNTPGSAVVYTAGSTSLALLEMLVHLQWHELIKSYVLFEVSFDDALVTSVDLGRLPKNWRKSPPPLGVQKVGDAWIAGGGTSAVLRVPSSIVPSEWNYLLNPAHPDFAAVRIGLRKSIRFDPRMIKRPTP